MVVGCGYLNSRGDINRETVAFDYFDHILLDRERDAVVASELLPVATHHPSAVGHAFSGVYTKRTQFEWPAITCAQSKRRKGGRQ